MMRQGSPYGQYQKYFNQGATYPYARYESDDEENELDRARELYKNLQGSPGGWQTRALNGQNRNLTRRLGETDQQLRQRTQEYERRLREGEDARSLLGSQLDDSRIEYGGLQQRYGDLESQVNQRNKEREEKRRAFQETYDKDYIEKQLLPVIQKHYPLSKYPGYKDLESMKQYPGSGYKPGMTGEQYKNKWDHPNYQNVFKQFPSYQPPQYPKKEDLNKRNSETESMYQNRIADLQRHHEEQLDEARSQYSDLQSRFGDEQSLYQGRMADFQRHQEEQQKQFNKYIHKPEFADQILRKKYNLEKGLYDLTMEKPWPDVKKYADEQGYKGNYQKYGGEYISGAPQQKPFMSYEDFEKRNHNKAFMTSLMPQFEAKYPQGDRTEAQHLANLGYMDPTYTKDPVSFLKQYQKYYPFANEETYQKYPTVDRFRDLSPASKQYLNIDQPNFKNFNKIYKQKFRDQESRAASDLQSQMEGTSSYYDKEFSSFFKDLDTVSQGGSIPDDRSYFAPSDVGKSQASFASSIASRQSLNRVGDLYRQGRQRETELSQLRGQYNQGVQDFKRLHATFDQEKSSLTRESSQWKAKHDALLPVVREFEINKPRLAEYPALKKFRQDYNHVNLNEYAKIPAMRQTLQNAPREAAALYKDAVDFYNSRHRNSYGKDYPGTISWGKKFGLL